MEPRDVGAFYLKDYFCEVLNGIKNKDGSFNKDVLKFFIKHSDVYNKLFNFKPQSAFAPLKNNNGDFDLKALDYADKKLTEKEKLQKLIPKLYSARDKDGNFSYEIMELNDYLSQIFKEWQINYVQEIALSFQEDKKKERDEFIELAKSMKNEQDFSQIFNFIKNIKANESTKSTLEFDKSSVDFLREMENSGDYNLEKTEIILKKIGMPIKAFSQKDIEILKKMCMLINKENIETFINASIKKAGKNKGKFDSSTLETYLDIYSKNRYLMPMGDIEYLAKCFALEEDDYRT